MKKVNEAIKNLYDVNYKDQSKELHKEFILPNKIFKEHSIKYDLKASPQDYLKGMIYMNVFCESNEYKIKNVFPLKKSIVPGHICLDTKTIIDLYIKDLKKKKLTGGIALFRDYIWSMIFKTEKKVFNTHGFKFKGMIYTDGFAVSILQDNINKKYIKKEKIKEKYINEITNKELKILKNKEIIAIDPNKDDLIFCIKGEYQENSLKMFRYTNNQRSKETRKRKNRKILLKEKKEFNIIEIEIETELSKYNSKTNIVNKFSEYIKIKMN